MPKGNSEVDKFFEGLPGSESQEADIFGEEKEQPVPEKAAEGEEQNLEKDNEPRKNRRHRRLEQQLQAEREARIAAEARAEGRAESGVRQDNGEVPADWLRMYGDTPETRQAWQLNKGIFLSFAEQAKKEAIQEIETRQQNQVKQQQEFETFIESELEAIEDEFDVDVTSDAPSAKKARRELLAMVEELSPKKDGAITGYADFSATWKMYQAQKSQAPDTGKKKELAARTMTKSGDTAPADKKQTPGFWGWKQDMVE